MTIRAYTGYNDYKKVHYYTDFEVVDVIPKVGEVDDLCWARDGYKKEVVGVYDLSLDCEQGNDNVYNYDYYEVVEKTIYDPEAYNGWEDEENSRFIAVEKR